MTKLPLFFLFATSTLAFKGDECPEISPVADFDIDQYISKSWYIQRQQTTSYQPADSLYCVVATYDKEGKKQYFKDAITVSNYGNEGGVNQGSDGVFGLCAIERGTARLTVSPCFLPPFVGGPYWVVAIADDYSYAIVVGGQPKERGQCEAGLCTTKEGGPFFLTLGSGEGLWFLTRERFPDESVLETMEAEAAALGLCTASMLDVVHEGCLYEGARIKA